MDRAPECGVLAIMGSGETSPTMVSLHRHLVDRLGVERPNAVLLETPYGFQENVADISARALGYFARSVGLRVRVVPGLRGRDSDGRDGDIGDDEPADNAAGNTGNGRADDADARAADHGLAMLRAADWIFSGPGSPSYALQSWQRGPVGAALRERIRLARGVTVLASAAAATMGCATVPVYEIYKVGTPARWLPGLDLLDCLRLRVAVIPHYDNAEGGNHDTRYSYLGERRLAVLERQLPDGAAVLGVDEHTAVVFDLRADMVRVVGRGGLTIRRAGRGTWLPAETVIGLTELRDLIRNGATRPVPHPTAAPLADSTADPGDGTARPQRSRAAPATLPEIVTAAEQRFATGQRSGRATEMVRAILDLETAIQAWSADTEEDEGTAQARAVLRSLIVRLGAAAAPGLQDPGERLRPLVEPLVALRERLRGERSYPAADTIRQALRAGGLRLDDTAQGPRWSVSPPVDP